MHPDKPGWLVSDAASELVLNELQAAVSGLPVSYLELLRAGNGGEVELSVSPYNLCLDSAESALDYWKSGTYVIRDAFVFGGNGGGTLLAFDMRAPVAGSVVSFDPIDPEGSMEMISPTFEQFIALVEEDDDE